MSFVENWTKRDEKQPYYAGERSQHTCDRAPGERSIACTCERAPGERSPICANVRTRASLNPVGALDNLKATPSLLVEVGN
jgi:hypothetical protein